jgi:hypothetical protein
MDVGCASRSKLLQAYPYTNLGFAVGFEDLTEVTKENAGSVSRLFL